MPEPWQLGVELPSPIARRMQLPPQARSVTEAACNFTVEAQSAAKTSRPSTMPWQVQQAFAPHAPQHQDSAGDSAAEFAGPLNRPSIPPWCVRLKTPRSDAASPPSATGGLLRVGCNAAPSSQLQQGFVVERWFLDEGDCSGKPLMCQARPEPEPFPVRAEVHHSMVPSGLYSDELDMAGPESSAFAALGSQRATVAGAAFEITAATLRIQACAFPSTEQEEKSQRKLNQCGSTAEATGAQAESSDAEPECELESTAVGSQASTIVVSEAGIEIVPTVVQLMPKPKARVRRVEIGRSRCDQQQESSERDPEPECVLPPESQLTTAHPTRQSASVNAEVVLEKIGANPWAIDVSNRW